MHKRGISTLIATVLIIGITISAFGIVYTFVMPLIKENIEANRLCGDVKVMINTQKGYTCYNSSNGQVNLQVSRGPDNINISSLQFKISGQGNSNTVNLMDGIKPVGLWHMDEGPGATTIIDSSGNGHTGKINSPPWINGRLENALNFDGVDDWVNYGNPAIFNFTNNDFSMEAWIKPNSTGDYMGIIGATQNGSDPYYWLGIEPFSNRLYAEFGLPGGGTISSSTLVTDGSKWYHVVFTKQSSAVKFYINGSLDSTFGAPTDLVPSNYLFRLGTRGGGQFFKGIIDEVRVYNRTLSSIEVSEHYNGAFNNESNLIGFWPLNEGSGISAADSSGNGNTGALKNFKSSVEYTSAGRFGGAYEFDGEKGYVKVDNSSSISFINKSFTLESWIYPHNGGGASKMFLCKEFGIAYCLNDNIGGFYIYSDSSLAVMYPNVLTSRDRWYHIVIVWDYQTKDIKLYLDSVLKQSASDSDGWDMRRGDLFIGGYGEFPFNGIIDEVAIYDRALNSEEIKKLYGGYEIIDKVISPNGERTYVINAPSLDNIDSASVAPVVKVGNKEHVCSMTADVQIQNC